MDYAGHMPPRLIYQQRRDGAKGGLRCNIRQMQVHLLNIAGGRRRAKATPVLFGASSALIEQGYCGGKRLPVSRYGIDQRGLPAFDLFDCSPQRWRDVIAVFYRTFRPDAERPGEGREVRSRIV